MKSAMLAFCLVVSLLTALATPAQPASPRSPTQESGSDTLFATRKALNVDFRGGSGADYVAAIREADAEANIVVLGELEKITIPAVRLRNADVASALEVLTVLPQQQDSPVANIDVKQILHDGDRSPVFTITAMIRTLKAPRPRTQETAVINMADLLGENLKPTDVLKAIESSLELIKNEYDPAQIRFHEETGLLIARGSPEQIESIRQMISQLHHRVAVLRQEQQQAANASHAEGIVAQLKEENRVLQMEAVRADTRAQLLADEVEKLRAVISELERKVRMLEADRDALSRRQAGESKPKTGE